MKTLLSILFFLSIGCVPKNDASSLSTSTFCKQIIISEDGDETVYDFDTKGQLLTIFGQSTSSFYQKGTLSFTLADGSDYVTYDISTTNADAWIGDKSKKNGFETFQNFNNNHRIVTATIAILSNGKIITNDDIKHTYDGNGDASSSSTKRTSSLGPSGDTQTINSFYTDKLSQFNGHPFQWLIEENFSAGGHTNAHLTRQEDYKTTAKDSQNSVVTIGTITYANSYDAQGRISKIVKTDISNTTITDSNGKISKYPESKKTKTIQFKYNC